MKAGVAIVLTVGQNKMVRHEVECKCFPGGQNFGKTRGGKQRL